MSKRKATGKRLRFEIFKRDQFTCQYCGAHPPSAILHVDHVTPVAEGGETSIDNLVTACQACNLGKSSIPLSSVPKSLTARAAEIQERELQLRGYQDIVAARNSRLDDETWDAIEELVPGSSERGFNRRDFNSVRHFIDQSGADEVGEAARLAYNRVRSEHQRFRYFCGICWNLVRGPDARA